MDFRLKENEITEYVENNFNSNVPEDVNHIEHFINEFLDFDHYVYDNTLFFQFDNYDYEELTNQSRLETCNMRIFIVVRNGREKELHERLRDYVTAFYTMFEKSVYNLGGIVDTGMITAVGFYDAVEGNKNIKLCEITLSLLKETI
jgi:hypothetical protein